jgi:hypothetical protein
MTTIPEAYAMCSRIECEQRQREGVVSIFEATYASLSLPPSQRRVDPHRAVARYRRSAAGGSASYPCRTLSQMTITVDFLQHILCTQQLAAANDDSTRTPHPLPTLTQTVAFVKDRIRALQVECVRSQYFCAPLQVRLIRMQLLMMYLLQSSDTTTTVFVHESIATSFAHYWWDPATTSTSSDSSNDEVLALQLVYVASRQLLQQQSSSCLLIGPLSSLLYVHVRRRHVARGAKVQWALRLLHAVSGSYWRMALSLLDAGPDTDDTHNNNDDTSFGILARCCWAPCLRYVHFQLLNMYNSTLMKGEVLTLHQVIRLLFLRPDTVDGSPQSAWDEDNTNDHASDVPPLESESVLTDSAAATAALQLCQSFEFAIQSPDNEIVFKSGPLQAHHLWNASRCDAFVFHMHWHTMSSTSHVDETTARIDSEGRRIPPARVMRQILLP